jgi:hypothetical protein
MRAVAGRVGVATTWSGARVDGRRGNQQREGKRVWDGSRRRFVVVVDFFTTSLYLGWWSTSYEHHQNSEFNL